MKSAALALCGLLFIGVTSAKEALHPVGPDWDTLDGAVLIENPNNDGDSLQVRWQDKEFTVRIYFVDAQETNIRYRDRVKAQADYFGITPEQTVEAGEMAADYVLGMLRTGDVRIVTRWQRVFSLQGTGRVYGFVTVNGRDLGELLVENGLGRIHGQPVAGLTQPVRERLRDLEDEAKAARRGAWGLAE